MNRRVSMSVETSKPSVRFCLDLRIGWDAYVVRRWHETDRMNIRPEWRNWQTRRTQNPLSFTGRVGSIPSSGTTDAAVVMAGTIGGAVSVVLVVGYLFWRVGFVRELMRRAGLRRDKRD